MLKTIAQPDGWTAPAVRPPKRLFVSPDGSDSAPGTEAKPKRTLAAAAKLGRADITLRRGATWWNTPPVRLQSGTVVSSYGDWDKDRPTLHFEGKSSGFDVSNTRGVGVYDLALVCDRQATHCDGIWAAKATDLHVEGNLLERWGNCITGGSGACKGWTVRRNFLLDARRDVAAGGHSQGLYAAEVDDLLLEENVFHRCGWGGIAAKREIFNQAAYITGLCRRVRVHRNVFSQPSHAGLQLRSGGDAVMNLFLACPVGMDYGLVRGDGPHVVGGVTGTVSRNLFYQTASMGKAGRRGMMLEIGNVKDAIVTQNGFMEDGEAGAEGYAIYMEPNSGKHPTLKQAVGIMRLRLEENWAWRWKLGIRVENAFARDGTGTRQFKSCTATRNRLGSHRDPHGLVKFVEDGEQRAAPPGGLSALTPKLDPGNRRGDWDPSLFDIAANVTET